MDKLKISRVEAEKEATLQGMEIPEEEFSIKKSQRGRPKKDTSAVDSSESESDQPKKTSGRPKKDKAVTTHDKIQELVKIANEEAKEEAKEEEAKEEEEKEEEKEEEEEEEETEVKKFVVNGKTYLKANNNTLYDEKSWEEVGMWDEEQKQVVPIEEDDE